MIFIFSKNFDTSTCDVINWFNDIHIFKRINSEELYDLSRDSSVKISNKSIEINDYDTNLLKCNHSVWLHSQGLLSDRQTNLITGLSNRQIQKGMQLELDTIHRNILSLFKDAKKLGSEKYSSSINKFSTLKIFAKHNLLIPDSLLTNNKKELLEFKWEHNQIITKFIANSDFFEHKEVSYAGYATLLSEEFIQSLPDYFYPIFVQKYIEKEFEIRTFYMDGKCWSSAIFSQSSEQTKVDFRRYDSENENRIVPYKLPDYIEEKLKEIMCELEINTGSFDIIKCINDEYFFLEVNPTGQFGMVSKPCNYYIEREIANFLMTNG